MSRRCSKIVALCLTLVLTLALAAGCKPKANSFESQLVEPGKLTMGNNLTYPPMEFYTQDGQAAGFNIELGNEVAKRLGLEPVWLDLPFDSLVNSLLAKRMDCIFDTFDITPERQEVVDFSDSHFQGGLVIITAKGNPAGIHSEQDLSGKTVAVQIGTSFESWLKGIDEEVKAAGKPGLTIKTFNGQDEVFTDIVNGRSDATIVELAPGAYAVSLNPDKLEIANTPAQPTTKGIAFRKDTPELRDAVNKALADIKADGTYQKIYDKWIGQYINAGQ